jgi:hypothetical protein
MAIIKNRVDSFNRIGSLLERLTTLAGNVFLAVP